MRSQWNGSDDLTCFKGLVGGCGANSRRACCVGVLPSEQTGSVCDGACSEFDFRGCPSAGRPGFGEAHGESCLLVCLLSALPSSDGSSQREGELSALFTSPFPVSTAVLGASWVCGEYELLERTGSKQDCSRVTSGKFLIIFSISSCIPE